LAAFGHQSTNLIKDVVVALLFIIYLLLPVVAGGVLSWQMQN
jgi:hypothetical protein